MSSTEQTFDPGAGDAPEVERVPSGTEFGSYRIAEAIAGGAMGTVYRAEHAVLGKQVAIKLMAPSLRSNIEARQRFLLEAKTTAAIKHRHVIEIFDFGECGGNPYIVMELLEGEDLEHYLEARTRLPAEEAASLLLPIVAALGAAHDAGVVHRDLKPSNIFLHREPDGELVPKLLDFGISKQTLAPSRGDFQGTSWNQLLGSPHYLPPEAVNGCRDLTAQSDQYSFGVVLYESVTGRAPIERTTLFELLTAITHAEFAPPSQGVPELAGPMEETILRCMQRDPAARFASVRELGRALLELADERARLSWGHIFQPQAPPLAPSQPPRRFSSDAPTRPPQPRTQKSSRWQALALAAASCCVLVVAGVSLLAAAPPAPAPDLAFRATHEASSPALEWPIPALQEPTPEPGVPVPVGEPGASALERGGATPSEARTTAPEAGPATRAVQPTPPKRRTPSPQRPPRPAVAPRVRPTAASSSAAVGDPSVQPGAGAELRAGKRRQQRSLTSPDAPDPQALGANESPIFD